MGFIMPLMILIWYRFQEAYSPFLPYSICSELVDIYVMRGKSRMKASCCKFSKSGLQQNCAQRNLTRETHLSIGGTIVVLE